MRKVFSILSILILGLVLVACDNVPSEKETVKLSVWASELDQELTQDLIDGFKEHYADDANFEITLAGVSEADTKDEVLKDIEAAADVFAFADDQLNDLLAADALQEILDKPADVIAANGGADSGSVQAASRNGKLYAYPMTADNGYFLFYDGSVYTEEDVKTMDGILAKAKADGTKMTMAINNGWYLYSFFAGAGLTVLHDGVKNTANWNKAPDGINVLKALIDIDAHDGFVALADNEFPAGIKAGTISAGVNGVWNASEAKEAWGENYRATKLPTYTLNGEQVQMSSFAGYKLVGVNKTSRETGWAMKLANWLTNEESQIARFEARGLGPSNVNAASSDEVKANPAISALAMQSAFATVQDVGGNYWGPSEALGNNIVDKNLNSDSTDAELQAALDETVAGINAADID